MQENWVKVKDKLPEVNTLVAVRLTNGVKQIDFVNEPVNPLCPFQHYMVSEWRSLSRVELCELVQFISINDYLANNTVRE